jgi:hypothetical protein
MLALLLSLVAAASAESYWWSCVYQCSPGWNYLNAGVCKYGEKPCPPGDSNVVLYGDGNDPYCWGSADADPKYAEQVPFDSKDDCESYTAMAKDFHLDSRKQDWETFVNDERLDRRLEEETEDASTALVVKGQMTTEGMNRRRLGLWSSALSWMKDHKEITKFAFRSLGKISAAVCTAYTEGAGAVPCKVVSGIVFDGLGTAASTYGRRLLEPVPAKRQLSLPDASSCTLNETLYREELIAAIVDNENLEIVHRGYPIEMKDDYVAIIRQHQIEDEAAIREIQNGNRNLLYGVIAIAAVLVLVIITLFIVVFKGKTRNRQLSLRIGALELHDLDKKSGVVTKPSDMSGEI